MYIKLIYFLIYSTTNKMYQQFNAYIPIKIFLFNNEHFEWCFIVQSQLLLRLMNKIFHTKNSTTTYRITMKDFKTLWQKPEKGSIFVINIWRSATKATHFLSYNSWKILRNIETQPKHHFWAVAKAKTTEFEILHEINVQSKALQNKCIFGSSCLADLEKTIASSCHP